jgi:hypothetical protein
VLSGGREGVMDFTELAKNVMKKPEKEFRAEGIQNSSIYCLLDVKVIKQLDTQGDLAGAWYETSVMSDSHKLFDFLATCVISIQLSFRTNTLRDL